ncbi:O-antigen ligase family protein [Flavobacterium sp. SUN046]|uniref:O-antigen ligase family protein n=1 Tax=Flavobacterium sp. SUN046 TaxID=3002440 RepID=UPI002DBFC5A4|nr:O-antigen ligase family protein [Flavobacterium sp. SUN046]MEC4048189.1 O-antigen ligase family protein [Flavobacterium sp. SUN046]
MKKSLFLNIDFIMQLLMFICCASIVFYRVVVLQSILLIILSILVLIKNIKSFKLNKKNWPFITLGIFLSTIYIINYDQSISLKKIGESLMLFIIPVLSNNFFITNNKIINKKNLLIFYSICVSFLCLYIINFYFYYSPHHKYDWYLARFFIELFLKFHSTYIGVWVGVSVFILIDVLLKIKNNLLGILSIVIMIIIQISTLLILNTRMALYSIIIISLINSLLFLNKKQKIYGLIITLTLITSILVFTNRYKEDTLFVVKNSIVNSPRYPIYYCSLKLIKDSFWIGNNPTTLQTKQNDCYTCLHHKELAEKDTNSHSQYFDFFLKGGVFLFIAFIIMLFHKLKYTLQTKNYLYFSISLFFCFAFLTENILSRQYGLFIYFFVDLIFINVVFDEAHRNNK